MSAPEELNPVSGPALAGGAQHVEQPAPQATSIDLEALRGAVDANGRPRILDTTYSAAVERAHVALLEGKPVPDDVRGLLGQPASNEPAPRVWLVGEVSDVGGLRLNLPEGVELDRQGVEAVSRAAVESGVTLPVLASALSALVTASTDDVPDNLPVVRGSGVLFGYQMRVPDSVEWAPRDPRLQAAVRVCRDAGVTQAQFDKLLAAFVESDLVLDEE